MDEAGEESEVFVPLRRLAGGPAIRRERDRDARRARHVERHQELGLPGPGRNRGLSRADIVTAAVTVADAEGTDAVSMRRIARDLHAGAMSLYWHVTSIDELHLLMLEQVQSETEVPPPSGDWRADLRAYSATVRTALLRHPWASDFLGTGPPTGPVDAGNADRLLALLDGHGFDLRTSVWAAMTVVTYVQGAAVREIQEIRWHRAEAEREAELSEAELAAERAEYRKRITAGSGRYPHLARLVEAGLDPDDPETRDQRFEFGLGCVLDGIAARAGAHGGSAAG